LREFQRRLSTFVAQNLGVLLQTSSCGPYRFYVLMYKDLSGIEVDRRFETLSTCASLYSSRAQCRSSFTPLQSQPTERSALLPEKPLNKPHDTILELSKNSQIKRCRHGRIPRHIRMQLIPRIILRSQHALILRIPHHRIKVEDVIKNLARPNPLVDTLPRSLSLRVRVRL
jgi:hypothetical protein